MQKFVFVATLAAFGLLTGGAWASTTISTTKTDVLNQCGNGKGCTVSCGGTGCVFACQGSKCTVTILRAQGQGTRNPTTTGGGSVQRQ